MVGSTVAAGPVLADGSLLLILTALPLSGQLARRCAWTGRAKTNRWVEVVEGLVYHACVGVFVWHLTTPLNS